MPEQSETGAAPAVAAGTTTETTNASPRLKEVEIEGEKFFIAEGDLLLDEDELGIYQQQQETLARERALKSEKAALGSADIVEAEPARLVGVTENGKLVRWEPGTVLSYCVLKNTFSNTNYQMVRENMAQATAGWEAICGVRFQYRADLDESPTTTPAGVLFVVREIDAQGQFIASAFFPNGPKNRRRVLIDPSYYREGLTFDRVGVLRHELGHVLGFRHEHIRSGAPAACPDESTAETFDFTPYDPNSVMHYFCGGVGKPELAITELDRTGAQKLYGPPLNTFVFATQ
ncbi:MAG: M57 family metalloprotease [Pyrinomonadaceae bacterium]